MKPHFERSDGIWVQIAANASKGKRQNFVKVFQWVKFLTVPGILLQ
jgi:hypothetical protein